MLLLPEPLRRPISPASAMRANPQSKIQKPISPPPLVAIVTLSWNRRDDTLAFLASCRDLAYPRYATVLVDNGSTDGTLEAVAAAFPEVELLANGANLGFAAGMNAGIGRAIAAGADYVFVANNDTTLDPALLSLLVGAARARGADLAAPAIYYFAEPRRIWWLGGRLRPLLLEVRRYEAPPCGDAPFAVDFVTGCGMLISRRCLERVGRFDERFFMYYEDSDYCLRVRRAGLRAIVEPRAAMYHKVAVSSGGSDSPSERYLMARSSLQFFRKHARPWQWLAIAPYRAGSAARTLLRLLRKGRGPAARAYLRGLRDGLLTGRSAA
jgi:GT2 family glycosyltransferase